MFCIHTDAFDMTVAWSLTHRCEHSELFSTESLGSWHPLGRSRCLSTFINLQNGHPIVTSPNLNSNHALNWEWQTMTSCPPQHFLDVFLGAPDEAQDKMTAFVFPAMNGKSRKNHQVLAYQMSLEDTGSIVCNLKDTNRFYKESGFNLNLSKYYTVVLCIVYPLSDS